MRSVNFYGRVRIIMRDFFSSFLGFIWELVKIAVFALLLAGVVRYFIFQPFFVNGASMEPNFDDGQYLIVDELSYYFRAPERAEVIVFKYPLDTRFYYIKRVIGLPNETVEIKSGQVVIYNDKNPDGLILKEDYLPKNFKTDGNIKRKLSPGEYFVLGDNRLASSDSRRWGVLPKNDIVGRVLLRVWPVDTFEILNKASMY